MIILTDCDGVLLSWVHSFEWWMKRKGFKKSPQISYKVSEVYGISDDEADVLVRHFNESAAIGFLPPLGDAIKYVRRIEELVGCTAALVSTSPEREDTILVKDPFEN